MNEYEIVLIDRCVKIRYDFLTSSEREIIAQKAKEAARDDNSGAFPTYNERYKRVKDALEEYFEENPVIVPEGFVNFRLRDMYYNVEAIVAAAYEIYLKEREYEEFTYLLSVFIEEKESREEVLHILWGDGRVRLLNKRGRDVTEKYEREFYEEARKRGINDEDLAISAVIAAAPEKIVLHKGGENSPLKEVLLKIFGDKARECDGCNICEKG